MTRRFSTYAAAACVLAIAAVAFLVHLGSSSLFSDETYSWLAASSSFGGVFSSVHATEVAPPGYYLLLHFWIGVFGSDPVSTMRLLSVLGGLALVGAAWWLGQLAADTWGGVLAATMAALSPLVIEYSQEIRAYIFAMLCSAVAVGAAIEATRRPRAASRWIAVCAAASVATIWVHYTGLLVILPVLVYVATSSSLSSTLRWAYAAACGLALAVVAPLMIYQLRAGHQGGVAPFAQPTLANFARVIGTPFDGRFAPQALTYLSGAGAVIVSLAFLLAKRGALPQARAQWLLIASALTPVLAIAGVTLAAKLFDQHTYYSLITRYTAVAAIFMLVAIAVAMVHLPRPAAIALAALVAVAIGSGLSSTYSSGSSWPDLQGAFARIATEYRAGDRVDLAGGPAAQHEADYYVAALRRERPGAVVTALTGPALPRSGPRLWVVSDAGSEPAIAAELSQAGWRTVGRTAFDPGIELTLASRGPAATGSRG